MSQARYFLPDHPRYRDVYTKEELRALLQSGEVSRSDIVNDDDTGLAHLVSDILASPYPDAMPLRGGGAPPKLRPRPLPPEPLPELEIRPQKLPQRFHEPLVQPIRREFRGDTPVPGTTGSSGIEIRGDDLDPLNTWEDAEFEDEATDFESQTSSLPEENVPAPQNAYAAGEEMLLYMGHPSWRCYPKAVALMLLGLGATFYCYQMRLGLEWVTLLGSLSGLVGLFISLDRISTTYFITTRRVEVESGMIGNSSKEVRICDIRAIDVVQKGLSAIVGTGTVNFDSSASAGPEVCFKNVRRPHEIKRLVRQLQA